MSWADFKKAYVAGRDSYREAKSRWMIPVTVVTALTIEICRRHAVPWTSVAVLTAIVLAVFALLNVVVEKYVRHHDR